MHSVGNSTAPAAQPPVILAYEITTILQRAGHPRPEAWLTGLHPDALLAATDMDVQRFLINRYWHVQIGALPAEAIPREASMDIRYCLVPQGNYGRWMELFETKVAPWIVKNDLPKAT